MSCKAPADSRNRWRFRLLTLRFADFSCLTVTFLWCLLTARPTSHALIHWLYIMDAGVHCLPHPQTCKPQEIYEPRGFGLLSHASIALTMCRSSRGCTWDEVRLCHVASYLFWWLRSFTELLSYKRSTSFSIIIASMWVPSSRLFKS